jgi:hypothetical protein
MFVLLVFSGSCASPRARNSAVADDPRIRMIAWPEWTPTSVALLEQQENGGYLIVANAGGNAAATSPAPSPSTTTPGAQEMPASVEPTREPATLPAQPSPQSPASAAQSGAEYVEVGKTVSFAASADGSPPLSYQWRKNGRGLAGQTRQVLTIANAQASDAGMYDCIVKNSAGEAAGPPVTLIVREQ